MSQPFYLPEDPPSGIPTQQQIQQENAFRDAQNALRRRVLPASVEQALPDLAPLSLATVPVQNDPSMLKLIAGGVLRQRLGVDIFAASKAKAARAAQEAYAAQTNNMLGVSLDAVAEQIEDPREREAYLRRVAGLTPLERRILESPNPGAYASLPAETLKLLAPGSTDPTEPTLQQIRYFERMRDTLLAMPDVDPKQIEAANAVLQRLSDSVGLQRTTLSPGAKLVDSATGRPIAQGDSQATSADNFVLEDGSVEAAIPGTMRYYEFVARGLRRAPNEQTIRQLAPVDKTVERDFQAEALKTRFAVERLVPIRRKVLQFGELTRPTARFGSSVKSFKDAIGLASESEKEGIRQAASIASDLKYEFALLVQNLTGAAASENQLADYEQIISNWETYSPTELLERVESALVRGESLLARRFAYDEIRQSDEGFRSVAPWEMSTQRAQEYFQGAVVAVLEANKGGPYTEAELRQQAVNALAFEAGVSTDAIERILRGE